VKEVEVTAKTVEEATQMALEQLGVGEDNVEIEVVKKGSKGVFGMGGEEAKIKVRLLDGSELKSEGIEEAKVILGDLVHCLGIDAEINIVPTKEDGSQLVLNIEGDDLGVLIGRHGQALSSLQYIVRLILAEKIKRWIPINVDVAGYKKRRHQSLKNLALRLATQVKTTKRSINLEPMPSDERRIIHITLADHPDVFTQSTGDGDKRKVVIQLRKR
jgi:spoIIIJ-associated protein